MSFIFDKLPSPPLNIYFKKDALNYFLVHSNAKNSFISAKNVVFFLVLHFGRHANGKAIAPPSPRPPLATLLQITHKKIRCPAEDKFQHKGEINRKLTKCLL